MKLNDIKVNGELLKARIAHEKAVHKEAKRRKGKEEALLYRAEQTGLTREQIEFALSSGLVVSATDKANHGHVTVSFGSHSTSLSLYVSIMTKGSNNC